MVMPTQKLLTPDNHALLLIDHQYLQLQGLEDIQSANSADNGVRAG
jgi:hypothetical protein